MSEINRDTLMAYIDGQLDASAAAALEAELRKDATLAADLAIMRRQADAIRALHPAISTEPNPARLDPHRITPQMQRRRWSQTRQAAMVIIVLALGIGIGWLLRPAAEQPALYNRLIADAISAHTIYVAEGLHAVEVTGGEDGHLATWLSDRLKTQLAMPDLMAEGYAFLGGRLLPAPALPNGRAAQLMYEKSDGERLTLYVTPATGVHGPEIETVRLGNDTALYWADSTITSTIVASEAPEQLEAIAKAVFSQLSPVDVPDYREL